MMRVVFFVLLVVNLLLAAWLMSVSPALPPEPPPIPDDLARLQLLSELDRRPAPGDPARSQEPVADSAERTCYSVGPFATEADARRVTDGLAARILRRETIRGQIESEIGHWVYLPAFPNRESAMEAARRLDEAGLRDYYVITAGDQENTISLGLYRDPGNAQGRMQRIRQLGFDARGKVRTEVVPRYRLQLVLGGEEVPDWSTLLTGSDDAAADEIDCPLENSVADGTEPARQDA